MKKKVKQIISLNACTSSAVVSCKTGLHRPLVALKRVRAVSRDTTLDCVMQDGVDMTRFGEVSIPPMPVIDYILQFLREKEPIVWRYWIADVYHLKTEKNLSETARFLNVSRATINRWISEDRELAALLTVKEWRREGESAKHRKRAANE